MVNQRLRGNLLKYALLSVKLLKNQQWSRRYSVPSPLINNKQTECSKNCRWRVLFFGTDEFALESLKRLNREYRSKRLLDRLEAVTAYEGEENVVIKYALDNGIKVHHWPVGDDLGDFDIGLVVSFGHLIPSRVIKSFPLGMINVHASLLPRWRGAAPIIYALMNGDSITGVTIMKIAPKKFDVGEILDQKEVKINDDETQPELYKRLSNTGGDLLIEILTKLPHAIESGRPQSNENVTYAPKIQKSISIVKWDEMTAREVYNLQRALTGIFPLTTTFQSKSLKIFGVKLLSEHPKTVNNSKTNPGMILYDKENHLLMIQCKNNSWVTVKEISLARKRKMSAADFNNGYLKNRCNRVIIFGAEQEIEIDESICERL